MATLPAPAVATEPLVVQVLREWKSSLEAREAQQIRQMADRWARVEQALDAEISALALEMDAKRRDGAAVSPWTVWRLERYQALKAQVRAQIAEYEVYAGRSIAEWQEEAARLGIQSAYEALMVSYPPGVGPSFRRLPAEAVGNMVGLAGDGSPLFGVLQGRALFPEAVDGLVNALVRGTALGWNPNRTAREMRNGLAGGLQKAMVIARTEQLRVYRHAAVEQYRASGVVKGFRRLATKDTRTCMACLVSDGEVFRLEQELTDHPAGRCAAVPVVDGMPEVQWEKGADWFQRQPPEVQRQMMGAQYYEAWRRGDFRLGALRSTAHSDVWGDSPRVTPLKLLRGGGQEAPKVMGYTWFRGQLLSVTEARRTGEAPDGWAAHEKVFKEDYLPRFRLKDDVERTIGLWDAPEPSFNARVTGAPDDVLAMAKAWGSAYNQQAMAVLLPDPQGSGGRLAWDLGRRLTDSELDAVLGAVRRVNEQLAGGVATQYGLEEVMVGLTVRRDRTVEYWVPDYLNRDAGQTLLEQAISMAGLQVPAAEWIGGYTFRLLFQGRDY